MNKKKLICSACDTINTFKFHLTKLNTKESMCIVCSVVGETTNSIEVVHK